MQQVTEINSTARGSWRSLDEQAFRVVHKVRQLLHRGHAVESRSDTLLLRVDVFGEDVRVFW